MQDTLNGGWGHDTIIGGTGFDVLIGGAGYDWVETYGGGMIYLDQFDDHQIGSDSDHARIHLGEDRLQRFVTTGGGYDTVEVMASQLDGLATSVVLRDFNQSYDTFRLTNSTPYGEQDHRSLMDGLDTNNNYHLDGGDEGGVSVDYRNNILTIKVGDGDNVTFANTTDFFWG